MEFMLTTPIVFAEILHLELMCCLYSCGCNGHIPGGLHMRNDRILFPTTTLLSVHALTYMVTQTPMTLNFAFFGWAVGAEWTGVWVCTKNC